MGKGRTIRGIMKFLGKDEALRQANRLLNMDGGPGSGNFGHKGRPGKIGWSGAGGGSAFRTSSSGTASGYIGVQRTKAFKSIARIARSSKGYDDFIDGLSKEQRDLILEQCRSSGTKEGVREYTERLRQVMLSQKPAKSRFTRSFRVEN